MPQSELEKYLRIILKRKYLFIGVALVVVSVVAWGSFFLPRVYEARSTVFIERNMIKDMVKGVTVTPTSVEDRVRVLKFAMLSREFVLKVLRGLDQDAKTKNDLQLDEMIKNFQSKTDINIRGNDLFIVTFRDKDPKLAADYINALVRRYLEENISQKKEETFGANAFISEQVNVFKKKLDQTQEAIIRFRQQKGVYMSLDDSSVVAEIKGYQTEIETQKIHLNELLAMKKSLQRQLRGEEPFTVALLTPKKNLGGSGQIGALENKKKQLMVKYTENHPEVLKLQAEIEMLKRQPNAGADSGPGEPEMSAVNPIHQDLKQKLLQTESEVEAVNARLSQLRATISGKERELRNIPEAKKKLGDLENDRNTQKGIYDQLVMQQGKSEVSKQMEVENKTTTFRIEDPAVLPTKPVSPNRVSIILLGIVAGLGAGLGSVFLRESLDSTVRDTQVIKKMGFEVLAVIPSIYNEEVERQRRKRDLLFYACSGGYFLLICLALLHEVLGYTYIEAVIASTGLSI